MGWFNTAPTQNRMNNEAQINEAKEKFLAAMQTLTCANEFVQNQLTRAQSLTAQAFSIQGVASSLGKELQQVENELASYLVDGNSLYEEVSECSVESAVFNDQFELPRSQRSIHASGKMIATVITQNAHAMSMNVEELEAKYLTSIREAVRQIDKVDHQLNGSVSRNEAQFLSGWV